MIRIVRWILDVLFLDVLIKILIYEVLVIFLIKVLVIINLRLIIVIFIDLDDFIIFFLVLLLMYKDDS